MLRDLRSLNGTFIRGERVGEHYLQDGDEVTMGSTRLLFATAQDDYATSSRVRQALSDRMGRSFPPGTVEAKIGGSAERGRVLIESIEELLRDRKERVRDRGAGVSDTGLCERSPAP